MAKTTASDLEVGVIHKKINTIVDKTASDMIDKMDSGESPLEVVNPKTLAVMIAWVEKNDIKAHLSIDEEKNNARKKLEAIKERQRNTKITFIDDIRAG